MYKVGNQGANHSCRTRGHAGTLCMHDRLAAAATTQQLHHSCSNCCQQQLTCCRGNTSVLIPLTLSLRLSLSATLSQLITCSAVHFKCCSCLSSAVHTLDTVCCNHLAGSPVTASHACSCAAAARQWLYYARHCLTHCVHCAATWEGISVTASHAGLRCCLQTNDAAAAAATDQQVSCSCSSYCQHEV
jgi:hypothetical protein